MRSSSELTPQAFCGKNQNTNLTAHKEFIIRASAVKEVWNMVLAGDLPNDEQEIRDELASAFEMRGIVFEQQYQKQGIINMYAGLIHDYCNWEQRNVILPEMEDPTNPSSPLLFPDSNGNMVDNVVTWLDGKPIRAVCDYITKNGNEVTIVREHTGRTKAQKDISQMDEIYPLILLGKKLYPNAKIRVEENFLRNQSSKEDKFAQEHQFSYEPSEEELRAAHRLPRSYPQRRHVILDTPELEAELVEHYNESMENEVLDGENCNDCPRYNICHYTEPPIPRTTDVNIRPFSEIQMNDSQQAVVENDSGISRVNAGAGSGKTMTVAMRNVRLLQNGVLPENILNITFTNAGASEMKERIKRYAAFSGVDVDFDKLRVQTFNSYCQDLISEYYEELGYTAPPRPLQPDHEIRAAIINDILGKYPKISCWAGSYERFQSTTTFFNASALDKCKDVFTRIKEGDKLGSFTRDRNPWLNPVTSPIKFTRNDLDNIFLMYDEYNNTLKAHNLVEFADQIKGVQELVQLHPTLFDTIGFEHIMVDEFQDTDFPQVQLLQELKESAKFKSLMCIGDDSQAIFGFRHTSPEYMINFGQYLGEGNEAVGYTFNDFNILENYRSTGNIIQGANAVIDLSDNRIDKTLTPTREEGAPVLVNGYYTEKQEYETVAHKIKDMVDHGTDPADISFLASTGAQLQKMADALTKIGVPSILMNPIPYSQNSRCAAVASFFDSYLYRTTQGVADYLNAKLHGGLMDASNEQVEEQIKTFTEEHLGEEPSVEDFLAMCDELDPDQTDECFQDFLDTKLRPCKSMDELTSLFDAIRKYGQSSKFKREKQYDGVALSTIHSAKGREWCHVFYTLDNFDSPSFRHMAGCHNEAMEEKYRLWFVAASRARDTCECVGTYTTKANPAKGEYNLNGFLKEAYNVVGRPFGFNSMSLWAEISREKQEAKEQAERVAERSRERALTRGARQNDRLWPDNPNARQTPLNGRVEGYQSMTPEQRAHVMDHLSFEGQMSIDDYVNEQN
jgi:superfamily I DNA/RNA helicase